MRARDAFDVTVDDRGADSEGDAGHGAGGVASHAGQGFEGFDGGRKDAAELGCDAFGRKLEEASATVVSESFPEFEHAVFGGGGEIVDRGKGRHEALEVGNALFHLGLLKHDLGDPDRVGIARLSPREIARFATVPRQKVSAKGTARIGCQVGHGLGTLPVRAFFPRRCRCHLVALGPGSSVATADSEGSGGNKGAKGTSGIWVSSLRGRSRKPSLGGPKCASSPRKTSSSRRAVGSAPAPRRTTTTSASVTWSMGRAGW